MIKFFACVECSKVISDKFEVGRALGKLIRENSWVLIDYGMNSDDLVDRTTIGFTTLAGAIGACIALDDLRVAGMSTFVIKAEGKK